MAALAALASSHSKCRYFWESPESYCLVQLAMLIVWCWCQNPNSLNDIKPSKFSLRKKGIGIFTKCRKSQETKSSETLRMLKSFREKNSNLSKTRHEISNGDCSVGEKKHPKSQHLGDFQLATRPNDITILSDLDPTLMIANKKRHSSFRVTYPLGN